MRALQSASVWPATAAARAVILAGLVKAALGQSRVLVEYLVTGDRSYAFVMSEASMNVVPLGIGRAALRQHAEKLVEPFRQLRAANVDVARLRDDSRAAWDLYRAVFAPAVDIMMPGYEHHDVRTTLTLDDDVAARLRAEARRRDQSFRETVNDTLRRGLASPRASAAGRDPAARHASKRPASVGWYHAGVEPADILAFARRDWAAAAEAKAGFWAERKRGMTAEQALATAEMLRQHARALKPDWPDARERSEDFAVHVRVSEALRAVPAGRTR